MKVLVTVLCILAVAVFFSFGGGHAMAQDKAKTIGPECQQSFNTLDRGNKGYLTVDDFEAMHHEPGKHKGYPVGTTMDKTHFNKLDKNKDGKVTLQEYCSE